MNVLPASQMKTQKKSTRLKSFTLVLFLFAFANCSIASDQQMDGVVQPATNLVKPRETPIVYTMEKLRSLVAEAVNRKVKEVIIPPGVYRGAPAEGERCVMRIQAAKELHIKADGVTMLCTKLARAIQIDNCQNLKISGLAIDYDPVPFTQGDIVKVAEDGSWVDVKIHLGYPVKAYSRIDIVDPKTRMRKRGMPYLWGAKSVLTEPGIVRVTQKDLGKIAQVGDLASMSTGEEKGFDCHAVVISGSEATTFDDITIYCAPGMGIVESGGEGNAHFNGVKIIPGPPPPGATEKPILTTSWDAIQHNYCHKGPLVENCLIEDAGDDSWSVQASDYLVLKNDGLKMLVAPRDQEATKLLAGDRLRQSLASPEATIRQVVRKIGRKEADLAPEMLEKLDKAEKYSLWHVRSVCLELTLDKPSPFAVGESVYSPDRRCEGYVFRNNQVNSSGRILLKAGHGLIENNALINLHGIMVCPEIPGNAAAGISDITIRNNSLIAPGHFCENMSSSQAGAIAISADENDPAVKGRKQFRPAGVFENILIENNLIQDSGGVAILVGSAKNVVVKNNRIVGSHQTPPLKFGATLGIDQSCAIYFTTCDGVVLKNNRIENPGKFLKKDMIVRDDVLNLKKD